MPPLLGGGLLSVSVVSPVSGASRVQRAPAYAGGRRYQIACVCKSVRSIQMRPPEPSREQGAVSVAWAWWPKARKHENTETQRAPKAKTRKHENTKTQKTQHGAKRQDDAGWHRRLAIRAICKPSDVDLGSGERIGMAGSPLQRAHFPHGHTHTAGPGKSKKCSAGLRGA